MDTDIDMDKDMDSQTYMERDKNRDKTWRHGHIDRQVRAKTRRLSVGELCLPPSR